MVAGEKNDQAEEYVLLGMKDVLDNTDDVSVQSERTSTRWNFRNTLAFWASVFYIQGATLFTIGSICSYPGILGNVPEHIIHGWVDYPFLVGAMLFLVGNYLLYFQVINETSAPRTPHGKMRHSRTLRFLVWPTSTGVWAASFNMGGALLFIFNTSTFALDLRALVTYDFVYVATGAIGSLCFVAGGVCEGEHNEWRNGCHKLRESPVWLSLLNTFGGAFFVLGYVVNMGRAADTQCARGHCGLEVWGVSTGFTVGSVLFLCGSWLDLMLWKHQAFGLGLARKLVGHSRSRVGWRQQFMIVLYCSNISVNWVRLGFLFAHPVLDVMTLLHTILELLTYHCIMLYASAVHTTPKQHPYDYIYWAMQFIAVYALATEIYSLYTLATT